MQPDPERLHEFVAVVREGSISRAARVLGVPRATLSRRLSSLEKALGVRLLLRETRPMRLTPAGEALHVRADRIVRDTRAAWEAVRTLDGVPRGVLRVSLPPSTPALHDYVVAYAARYPEVELVVTVDARHVDLQAAGIDVAVRVGPVTAERVIARQVWRSPVSAFAAPAYLARAGTPSCATELTAHRCITAFDGDGVHRPVWPRAAAGPLEVHSALACGDIALLERALRAGLGIGMMPDAMVAEAVKAGALVRVLPGVIGGHTWASAVYLDRTYVLPQTRAFIDGLVAHMQAVDA